MPQELRASDPAIWSAEAGAFISSKMERLAEIIQDYDQYLELRWIPPNARNSADSLPYAVVHNVPGNKPYTVFYFGETSDPVDILAKLFAGDGNRGNVLEAVEAQEAAQKAFKLKADLDEMLEAHHEFAFLLDPARSKNYVNWKDHKTGKIVKLDSDRRRVT